MREYRLYLNDILAAIASIESFVGPMDLEAFQADDKTASAVIRKLEIIEAAKQVTEDVRHAYAEVPWKEMAGMRDRLIHAYMGVDFRLLWKTIKEDLPTSQKLVRRILKENP